MERLIFHIDVNSAFLSWEATRRVQNGESDLRLVPSCIAGDPEKRTSIVTAKSIPAKKFGIETGESIQTALNKCPDLVIAKPDFQLYMKCSKAFKDICRSYAPAVEEFSIDECFLDMTGTHLIYPDPIKTAYEIKDKIKNELGFTVNVGIGPNKLLAKMASDFEKPDKVHTLFMDEIAEKMWPLPIRDLIFCGAASAEKLRKVNIKTIGDLAKSDPDYICQLLGDKGGKQMHRYANGISESPVKAEREEAKGYSVSTTTEENITDFDEADRILRALTDSVANRMRRDGKFTRCVAVSIRYTDFRTRSHQKKLVNATDVTSEIYETAQQLLHEFWDGHTPLRLMGAALTDLTTEEYSQMSLFTENNEKKEKNKKLDHAMDEIRERFGSDMIQVGSTMNVSGRIGRKYKTLKQDE